MASPSPPPELPVRFTMIRMFLRSMIGKTVSGAARNSTFSPMPTPFTDFDRNDRCVWTSITGKRPRETLVSGTCNMLFGWNSERSSFIFPAPSGDFTCEPAGAGSVHAPAAIAAPVLPIHCLRFIALTLLLLTSATVPLGHTFRLASFYIVYFPMSKWHKGCESFLGRCQICQSERWDT